MSLADCQAFSFLPDLWLARSVISLPKHLGDSRPAAIKGKREQKKKQTSVLKKINNEQQSFVMLCFSESQKSSVILFCAVKDAPFIESPANN